MTFEPGKTYRTRDGQPQPAPEGRGAVTHIKDAKPEPLTAEEEANIRAHWSADSRDTDVMAHLTRMLVLRLFATLDASRAETEAVRRERDEMEATCRLYLTHEGFARVRQAEAVRTLAAELVEGLAAFISIMEHCDVTSGCCMCGDSMELHPSSMLAGHAPVDMGAYHAEEAYKAAQALIARARALGVGGEREKNDGE